MGQKFGRTLIHSPFLMGGKSTLLIKTFTNDFGISTFEKTLSSSLERLQAGVNPGSGTYGIKNQSKDSLAPCITTSILFCLINLI